MELHAVAAQARERLGMELQAATLLGTQPAGRRRLEVWSLMTERASFWLVEGGSKVELFHASAADARSAVLAARQFLELHPERRMGKYDCRRCGLPVTPRRWGTMADRQLCRRCRHAERERERYRDDPEYRARKAVRNAERYRRLVGGEAPYEPPP